MAPTLAIIGYGSAFQTANADSPMTWSALAEVRGMGMPAMTVDVVDASHECAPDEWREVLTGLKGAGEIALDCNFIKTTYQALLAELGTRTIKTRRIVLPGGSNLVFDAFLISIEVGLAVGDLIPCVAKFRPSGEPTLNIV